jgi:hypothetical protein
MEATELRIENLVNEEWWNSISGSYEYSLVIINAIYKTHIRCQDDQAYNLDEITPILLTEEWLIKFGFDNKKQNNQFNIDEWRFHVEKPFQYDGFLLCDGFSVISDRIKYVHQLQNLYYSLTETELSLAKNKTESDNSLDTKS